MRKQPTLIPLFLDFKFLCQILIVLPLDLRANRAVVDEVASIGEFRGVKVCLGQLSVLKELVGEEVKDDPVSLLALRLGILAVSALQVLDAHVNEGFESLYVAFGDKLAEPWVIIKGR